GVVAFNESGSQVESRERGDPSGLHRLLIHSLAVTPSGCFVTHFVKQEQIAVMLEEIDTFEAARAAQRQLEVLVPVLAGSFDEAIPANGVAPSAYLHQKERASFRPTPFCSHKDLLGRTVLGLL